MIFPWRRARQQTDALRTIAVLIVEGHDHLIRTIKEARMSITSDLDDLRAEVAATKSAEAAATTSYNGVVQQLEAIIRQNADNPGSMSKDVQEFTAALRASREGMASAITANTPQAGQANPDAPEPAVDAASGAGSNTYGSTGPTDVNNQRNSSAGFAGSDTGAQPALQTGINGGASSTAVPVTAPAGSTDAKAPEPVTSSSAPESGSTQPASTAPLSSTTTPDTTKDTSSSASQATSATVAGDPAPEQDRPAGSSSGMTARTEESTNFGSAPEGNVASTAKADKE